MNISKNNLVNSSIIAIIIFLHVQKFQQLFPSFQQMQLYWTTSTAEILAKENYLLHRVLSKEISKGNSTMLKKKKTPNRSHIPTSFSAKTRNKSRFRDFLTVSLTKPTFPLVQSVWADCVIFESTFRGESDPSWLLTSL